MYLYLLLNHLKLFWGKFRHKMPFLFILVIHCRRMHMCVYIIYKKIYGMAPRTFCNIAALLYSLYSSFFSQYYWLRSSHEEIYYSRVLGRASVKMYKTQLILSYFYSPSSSIDDKRVTLINTGSYRRACMAPINKINFLLINPNESFWMANCPLNWNLFGCESEMG